MVYKKFEELKESIQKNLLILCKSDYYFNSSQMILKGKVHIEDSEFSSKGGWYKDALIIPDSVVSIGNSSFRYGRIKSIFIPNSVVKIGDYAFNSAMLQELVIPNSVTEIGRAAFCLNKIEKVVISSNLTYISDLLFSGNLLTEVIIPDKVTSIGNNAFDYNQLSNIVIPDSVVSIGKNAFKNNKLQTVILPSSLKSIGQDAFVENPDLSTIKFGDNVIGNIQGFDNLKMLDDKLLIASNNNYIIADKSGNNVYISTDDLKKTFGNIDKMIELFKVDELLKWKELYTSKSGIVDDVMLKRLDQEILLTLPANRENANLLRQGINEYKEIKKQANFSNYEENRDLFKMCYSLGVLSGNKDESKYMTEYIKNRLSSKTLNEENIHGIFDTFKLESGYNKDKAMLIIAALNDYYFTDNPEYIARIYNEYDEIKKYIEKEYKEIIGRDIIGLIRTLTAKENLTEKEKLDLVRLQDELTKYQKSINKPSLKDVKYYIENNLFKIRDENKELLKIVNDLKGINQEKFDRMQDLYEKSKGLIKEIVQTKDRNDEGYTYQWSASDNPSNLTLGYKLRCCAKIDGAGEDIMVQAMINPLVQNLIIRDENQNIVGKATVYYNKEKQYMLFNNVEALSTINKSQAIGALKRAIDDQIKALKTRGIELNEVRIGMLRNDLISDKDIEVVKTDLLENYAYKNYDGDANDPQYGQGILYKNLTKQMQETSRSR
jgi:hypothetical protein